ncbi:MAG: FeoA family protein [Pirellulaceae bacterium]
MNGRSLADLPAKTRGTVAGFELPDDESLRVRTLGVCPGMQVEVVQNGDPLILSTAGTRIGIARRIAACVFVDTEH